MNAEQRSSRQPSRSWSDSGATSAPGRLLKPQVLPLQNASLVVGDHETAAQPHLAATASLTFIFDKPNAPLPGVYFVRLRIDGVESLLVKRDVKPPAFDPDQKKTIP